MAKYGWGWIAVSASSIVSGDDRRWAARKAGKKLKLEIKVG
jgi:hypothetical protein